MIDCLLVQSEHMALARPRPARSAASPWLSSRQRTAGVPRWSALKDIAMQSLCHIDSQQAVHAGRASCHSRCARQTRALDVEAAAHSQRRGCLESAGRADGACVVRQAPSLQSLASPRLASGCDPAAVAAGSARAACVASVLLLAAPLAAHADATGAFKPEPVQLSWQIYVGAAVAIAPFAIGLVEFTKRIMIQRRCAAMPPQPWTSRQRVG